MRLATPDHPSTQASGQVVILGGGLAGLACAQALARHNRAPVLLEKDAAVGGLARTLSKGGFQFDTGPHRWYSKDPEIDSWLEELLGEELTTVRRLTRIYYMGRLFRYPLRPTELLRLGTRSSLYILKDLVSPAASRPPGAEGSLEEAFVEQFGSTLYERFFRSYSEKLWGRPCTELSADWARQRTRGLTLRQVLKRIVWERGSVRSLAGAFKYPRRGIGRIAEKLAEDVCARGGTLHLQSEVVSLRHRHGRLESVEAAQPRALLRLDADAVVSSIPITDLVRRLDPPAPQAVLDAAASLTFRDQIQVTLLLDGEVDLPDNWIYVQDATVLFTRLSIAKNWSSSLSPEGKTSVVFEVPCQENDHVWTESDAVLTQQVWDQFRHCFGTLVRAELLGSHVHRVEKEYPVFSRGYKVALDQLKRYLAGFDNLQLIGRNGTFSYNNMDRSVRMGLRAADLLLGRRKSDSDADALHSGGEYLEEQRR
jgi:protoporphyrinogen oxidase